MSVVINLQPRRIPHPRAVLTLFKPITWFPPIWAFLCGAVASGVPLGGSPWLVLGGMVLAGPVVCGMSQAANDWCDRHVDAINEPHRPIPSGQVPGRWGLWIALVTSLVALAFLAANIIGAWVFMGGDRGVVALLNNGWGALTIFALVPIPLFLLMGEIFFQTGLGSRMFSAIDKLLGRLPGRLSYVTVLGGTGFSTLSGSSMGSTALLGSLMVPEMNRRGYKSHMSIGPILGTGGLAIIIPPSALAVLLATLAKIDVGALLIAGVIPGLILAGFYVATIYIQTRIDPEAAPAYDVEPMTAGEKIGILMRDVVPMIGLMVAIVGPWKALVDVISWVRAGSASSPTTTMTGTCVSAKSAASGGVRAALSRTTRTGERPRSPGRRQVRRGLSATSVPMPTTMASCSARRRWARAREAGPVMAICPAPGAIPARPMPPSAETASFSATNGRCRVMRLMWPRRS